MAYKYGFFDNQKIGVDDLNGITERFVTDGIAIDPKSVGEFTGFNSMLSTMGVVPETVASLKVYMKDGILYITPGCAFFENGTFIEITEAETLEYTENVTNYIFLRSDANACTAYPVCSEKKNEEQDVLLAILNADGTITDKRQYAKGKSPCYYSSANNSLGFDAVFEPESEKYEFDIGVNNFTKMILVFKSEHYSPNEYDHYTLSFVEFNDDGSVKTSLSYVRGYTRLSGFQQMFSADNVVYVCHEKSPDGRKENLIDTNVKKEGTKLVFTPVNSTNHNYSSVTAKIYLM